MNYKWKPGVRLPVSAQVAGDRLEKIRLANNGVLTPALVVRDAKSPSSPFHRIIFKHNDKAAAARFREDLARHIIRHIVAVVTIKGQKQPTSIIGFVRVSNKEVGSHYTATAVAMSDADMRKQVVDEALSYLHGWRVRYRHLNELSDIFNAIDRHGREDR